MYYVDSGQFVASPCQHRDETTVLSEDALPVWLLQSNTDTRAVFHNGMLGVWHFGGHRDCPAKTASTHFLSTAVCFTAFLLAMDSPSLSMLISFNYYYYY